MQVSNDVLPHGPRQRVKIGVLICLKSFIEAIEVEVDNEDKALICIWSLPSSYEHIKPILINNKEIMNFVELQTN